MRGLAGGSLMSGAEQEQLASLRLVLRGNRTVDASAVWSFYMDLSEQMAHKMLEGGGKIFQCTQGPGDMLYLPCGYVFAEKVGDADCLGMVLRGLVSSANDPGASGRVKALLSRNDKVSKFFGHVLDFYAISRPDCAADGENSKAAAAPAAASAAVPTSTA